MAYFPSKAMAVFHNFEKFARECSQFKQDGNGGLGVDHLSRKNLNQGLFTLFCEKKGFVVLADIYKYAL